MKWMIMMATVIGTFANPVFATGNAPGFVALAACGADQVQQLVGQSYDAMHGRFAPDARIIPPNSPVTEDYRPARLNVVLDGAGKITRIWCG